jgi:hypothetical protein
MPRVHLLISPWTCDYAASAPLISLRTWGYCRECVCELAPDPDAELPVGVAEVRLDGLLGDEQRLCDLPVRCAIRREARDPAGWGLGGVRAWDGPGVCAKSRVFAAVSHTSHPLLAFRAESLGRIAISHIGQVAPGDPGKSGWQHPMRRIFQDTPENSETGTENPDLSAFPGRSAAAVTGS